MIKVFVNNKPLVVPKNTSALEACEMLGVYIPRFCYHERLNVAGNCRMCLVEIEKSPKPVASCAFPVAPNMRIYTDTPMVQKAREGVMEFLLLNHPLDCPICDQGGECDLQEQSMLFGSDKSRFFYAKRGVEDKDCGPLVKTIMTRCIHCTRCVRFFQDVAGQEDFGTTLRGRETEIGTYIGKVINSELSGNIIDLCPVGALTSKPYAFVARPWEIKSVETIDVTDSVGANIKINFKESEILRILPTVNDSLNEEWISDKTRFCFDSLKTQRVGAAFLKIQNKFEIISWKELFEKNNKVLNGLLKLKTEQILFVCGNNLDFETIQIIKNKAQDLGVRLISEEYFKENVNLMKNIKSNITFEDILQSDLCLSVGTNTRFEAALLNVRLKKKSRMGNFVRASIGLCEDLCYNNTSIGNSLKTLVNIAEGKDVFCQKLVKAKKPFIIIGSGVKKRIDGSSLEPLFTHLSKNITIIGEDWLGINFLPLTANKVGESLAGVNTKDKQDFSKIKYIYSIGLDSYSTIFSKINEQKTFIVSQTPYADSFLQKSNVIIPSTTFTEKEGTYINLEGRVQKSKIVFERPNFAKNDDKIIKLMLSQSLSEKALSVAEPTILKIEKNKKSFTKYLTTKRSNEITRIKKTPFKVIISNFFSNNILAKNSQILSKCASIFKKNYRNYLEIIS